MNFVDLLHLGIINRSRHSVHLGGMMSPEDDVDEEEEIRFLHEIRDKFARVDQSGGDELDENPRDHGELNDVLQALKNPFSFNQTFGKYTPNMKAEMPQMVDEIVAKIRDKPSEFLRQENLMEIMSKQIDGMRHKFETERPAPREPRADSDPQTPKWWQQGSKPSMDPKPEGVPRIERGMAQSPVKSPPRARIVPEKTFGQRPGRDTSPLSYKRPKVRSRTRSNAQADARFGIRRSSVPIPLDNLPIFNIDIP